jgi:hypothetical protein
VSQTLRAVLVALLAVCGWFANPAASWSADVPPAASVAAYTYDAPDHTDALSGHAPERGPPSSPVDSTTHDAVDRWLHGPSVRSGPTGPLTVITYDLALPLVQVSPATTTTEGAAEVTWAGLWSLLPSHVAAETGGSVLSFGSRAAAREGLPGDLASTGNRFFRGATSKSQDFQAVELPGGGYRMQFFSPANNPGYGKLYVQEIDRTGQVLREYKNTMGPDGLIETKWVHGGP